MENLLTIRRAGQLQRYELLCVIDEGSPLRRHSQLSQLLMSLVVRCPDGTLRLYTRGALASVSERLACRRASAGTSAVALAVENSILRRTTEHVSAFDSSGLTTLAYSTRPLGESFFNDWFQRYLDAVMGAAPADDVQVAVIDELECGTQFLGSCAVELPLRHGVTEAVRIFHECRVPLTLASLLPHEPTISILQRSGIADAPAGSTPEGHSTLWFGTRVPSSPLFLAVLQEMQRGIELQRGGGSGSRLSTSGSNGSLSSTQSLPQLELPSLAPPPERQLGCMAMLGWVQSWVWRLARRRQRPSAQNFTQIT